MKQFQKLSILALTMLMIATGFYACSDDDGYSLDKFVVSLATVNLLDEATETYYLTLDNGETLWPAATDVYYKPKANQRIWVNYTLLSDSIGDFSHYVKINALREILTKNIVPLTNDNENQVGNDPVEILRYWIGDDYLNLYFAYYISDKTHTFNVVENQDNVESGKSIQLELRHNADGDAKRFITKNYGAFNLRSLQKIGQDSVVLQIKSLNSDNQPQKFEIIYHYNTKK